MFFDPLYFLFIGPGMVLALIATFKVKSTFAHYSQTMAASGMTGAEAARQMLARNGVTNVKIERASGFLSDHYDPTSHTLRLSEGVYDSTSLSAIGVACHEAGHALQHASAYVWLGLRSSLVPATQIGSWGSYIFFLLGMFMHNPKMILIGVILFSITVVFSLITLPVEWDASARAKKLMVSSGIVSIREQEDAGRVLNAAFLTYVASAITALLTLLYYLYRAGLLGGRRND
ncbi:MAG: zinc metallopeptidase [bacterium]|jgi:Zn-dependent membrane protease YugP